MSRISIIAIGLIVSSCSLLGTYERSHNDGYLESSDYPELKISAGSLFPYYHIELKANRTFLYYKPNMSDSPTILRKDGTPVHRLESGKWEKNKDTLILHLNGVHKCIIHKDSLVPINTKLTNWVKI